MECLPVSPVIELPPDLLTIVRRAYNLDKPGRMAEAVDILEEWVKKQGHFTKKDFPRNYLENTIIGCKGSLERAKSRMDKLCTFRTLMPKFFEITNIREEMASILHVVQICILPKLTKDNYRVIIVKVNTTEFKPTDFVKFINTIFIACEYLKQYDYALGYILISDYLNINVTDIMARLSMTDLQQLVTIITEGYGVRIKGVHFITPSKLIDTFITLIKQFIPEKIGKRLQVYKTVEDLKEFLPTEILPKEYGGKAAPSEELYERLIEEFSSEKHVNFVKEMWEARTDESFRQHDKFNDEYMGMPGTFRTLTVD